MLAINSYLQHYLNDFSKSNMILILKTTLLLLFIYVAMVVVKWLCKYLYTVWVINKIPGLPMIPFFGNSYQFLGVAG